MDYLIQHNEQEQVFTLKFNDKEYYLEYNKIKEDLWEFTCAYLSRIVTNLKDIEIRERIIDYALNFMQKNDIKILDSSSCLDVKNYLDRKKDFQFLTKYVI